MAGKSTVIPNFVTASTPRGLRRVMLRNNLRMGMQYEYNIKYNPKDKMWYAWFYEDIVRLEKRGIDGSN